MGLGFRICNRWENGCGIQGDGFSSHFKTHEYLRHHIYRFHEAFYNDGERGNKRGGSKDSAKHEEKKLKLKISSLVMELSFRL